MSAIKKPEWELRMDRVEKGFEETKEILREIAKSNKEFDKRSKEFDERFKSNGDDYTETREILKELAKDLKEARSHSKGNGDSSGTVAEFFFKEATEQGANIGTFGFLEQKHCNYLVYDENEDTSAEFNIVLTNEDFIFIVETKYRLDKKHLNFFTLEKEEGPDKDLNRIQILKKYKSEWIGDREIILAFASLGIKEEVLKAFTEAGYYVLTRKGGKIAVEVPVDKD